MVSHRFYVLSMYLAREIWGQSEKLGNRKHLAYCHPLIETKLLSQNIQIHSDLDHAYLYRVTLHFPAHAATAGISLNSACLLCSYVHMQFPLPRTLLPFPFPFPQ